MVRFMPPTTPIPGYGKMGLVFAKLIVDGEQRGTHPFLVTLGTTEGMCEGIQSKCLPPRAGSSPLDFAITTFNNVHLSPSAFLGESLDTPKDQKSLLHEYMWRTVVGAVSLTIPFSTATMFISTIACDYSHRRHVSAPNGSRIPIITFRTQQLPVLYAIAVSYVLDAWLPHAIDQFMDSSVPHRTRHGSAAIYKATVLRLVGKLCREVAERLGAQGTFGHNLLAQLEVRPVPGALPANARR